MITDEDIYFAYRQGYYDGFYGIYDNPYSYGNSLWQAYLYGFDDGEFDFWY